MSDEIEYVDLEADERAWRPRGRSLGEQAFWDSLDDGVFDLDELLEQPDPIGAAIRQAREDLKREIVEMVDGLCEFCDQFPGVDLHEVFVSRARVPRVRQLEIMVVENCGLACRACHGKLHGNQARPLTEREKARFQRRRERMGCDVRKFREEHE